MRCYNVHRACTFKFVCVCMRVWAGVYTMLQVHRYNMHLACACFCSCVRACVDACVYLWVGVGGVAWGGGGRGCVCVRVRACVRACVGTMLQA